MKMAENIINMIVLQDELPIIWQLKLLIKFKSKDTTYVKTFGSQVWKYDATRKMLKTST